MDFDMIKPPSEFHQMEMMTELMNTDFSWLHDNTSQFPGPQSLFFHNPADVINSPPITAPTFQEPVLNQQLLMKNRASMEAMREMIFAMAAMQPVHIDPESLKQPKRRNVRISKDPQSVAARHRRERISERIRILQRLVPGGTKMDTASMLDEAVRYMKYLKKQVECLERAGAVRPLDFGFSAAAAAGNVSYSSSLVGRACRQAQMVGSSVQMF